MTAPLHGDALRVRFDALDRWLSDSRPRWRPRPFAELPPPWAKDHPAVADWLEGLSESEVAALDGSDGLVLPDNAPDDLHRWHSAAQSLTAVGPWPQDAAVVERLTTDPNLRRGVGARKWDQVARFCGCCAPAAGPIVDWCGGKAHLGRTLGRLSQRAVTVVELNESLRPRAEELAAAAEVELHFAAADARDPSSRDHLGPGASVVALHACGGLTNALIRGARDRGVTEVAVAPCCFHLQHAADEATSPLSAAGRTAVLKLDHAALRLATVEEVKATDRQRALRRRENVWRLGLDLLLRQAGAPGYTALGRLTGTTLALPFDAFCARVAADQGLRLPESWSPEAAERAGQTRELRARALSTVRAIYRRPLELWLVLDRALALAEGGYEVGVGTFCDRAMTPRNLLIRGRGRQAPPRISRAAV